jgi:8-oxo-dGTP diphosphatase
MKRIIKITDEDFDLKNFPLNDPRIRYGARGIVFNDKNEIAILNKSKKNEYKLVGGGIEEDEDPTKAFKREVLEETGCKLEIDDCLGITEEIKSHDNFKQISYVYVAHVIEDTGIMDLTEEEKNDGARLLWLSLEDAIKKIKDCEDNLVASKHEGDMSIYHTKFIVRRDYSILKYYINKYSK